MNKKSVIFNSIIMGLAGLALILAFAPIDQGISSFYYMRVAFAVGAEATLVGLIIMLTLIALLVVFVLGLLNLLVSCGVIKSAKASKAFGIVNIVFSAIATLVGLFLTIIMISGQELMIGYMLVTILAIATLALSIVELVVARKYYKAQVATTPVEAQAEEPKAEEPKAE